MVRSTYLHVLRVVGSLVLCVGCGARSGLPESEGAGGASSTSSAPSTSGSSSAGVPAVSACSSHTCILTSGGAVRGCGTNESGELGDGSFTDSPVPVDVASFAAGVRAVAAGTYFTCAVTAAGAVMCWGDDQLGQLGNDSTNSESELPDGVAGLSSGVQAASAGGDQACALTSAGGLVCWGGDGATR